MMQIMKKSRAFLMAAVLILQLILLPLAEVDRASASEVSDQLKIVKGKDLCTLMTCTPYMINAHRLLVTSHRIPYNPKAEAKAKERSRNRLFWIIIAVLLPVLAIIIFIWHKMRKKKQAKTDKEKEQE